MDEATKWQLVDRRSHRSGIRPGVWLVQLALGGKTMVRQEIGYTRRAGRLGLIRPPTRHEHPVPFQRTTSSEQAVSRHRHDHDDGRNIHDYLAPRHTDAQHLVREPNGSLWIDVLTGAGFGLIFYCMVFRKVEMPSKGNERSWLGKKSNKPA